MSEAIPTFPQYAFIECC